MDEKTYRNEYLQIPVNGCLTINQIDRLPPGTTFQLSREYYYSHKDLWMTRYILYCPAHETAYKLDPDDPRDKKLIEHYTKPKKDSLWLI